MTAANTPPAAIMATKRQRQEQLGVTGCLQEDISIGYKNINIYLADRCIDFNGLTLDHLSIK